MSYVQSTLDILTLVGNKRYWSNMPKQDFCFLYPKMIYPKITLPQNAFTPK